MALNVVFSDFIRTSSFSLKTAEGISVEPAGFPRFSSSRIIGYTSTYVEQSNNSFGESQLFAPQSDNENEHKNLLL